MPFRTQEHGLIKFELRGSPRGLHCPCSLFFGLRKESVPLVFL
jgi:hypothetical protein